MIYLAIFFFIAICALRNYHKTILIYAPLRMFFHPGICLRYASPAIQLDFACCALFLILSIFYEKKRISSCLIIAYFFMLFSYVAAVFMSTYSISQAIPPMIGRIAWLLFSYLFFINLDTLKDVKCFHIVFIVCMGIMVGYGLLEYVIQENPIIGYQKAMSPNGMEGMVYGDGHERLGSIRCQSLSAISISYGAYCILWICFAIIYSKYYEQLFTPSIVYPFIVLCLVGAFSSGSKSPFILLLSFLGLYVIIAKGHKLFKTVILSISFFILAFFSAFLVDFYLMIVDSSQSSTAGSDIPMRLMQVAAVGDLMNNHSWLFGLGARGVMKAQILNPAVLGAESIWLQLALEQGILGCAAYLVMIVSLAIYGKNNLDNIQFRILIIFIISWVLLNTVTSLPGIDLSFFLCLCFVFIKQNCFVKRKKIFLFIIIKSSLNYIRFYQLENNKKENAAVNKA